MACIISIRTYDEVSLLGAQRLFKRARTPEAVAALPESEIDKLIYPATFHERKAAQIRAIARTVVDEHGGKLPCDRELMLSFGGVGPKCANLAMGVACGESVISVDIHVHRVTNRWGYVATRTPEKTIEALEAVLPQKHWIDINKLLVPFGKHICTGAAAEVLDVPGFGILPAGGGDGTPLGPINAALLVKLWRFFECFPLLLVMTENHQPDMLPFDQIKQFNRTGADRFGVRVATVVLLVTGKALAEGYSVNRQ